MRRLLMRLHLAFGWFDPLLILRPGDPAGDARIVSINRTDRAVVFDQEVGLDCRGRICRAEDGVERATEVVVA